MMQCGLFGDKPFMPDKPKEKRRNISNETRREALDAITPEAGQRRRLILKTLEARGPMTASEIANVLAQKGIVARYDRNFVAPRLTELQHQGLVEVIGKRKCIFTGRPVGIYRLVRP